MGIRAPLVMSLLMIAAMLAVDAWVWPHLPDNAVLAVHWSLDSVPKGHMHKLPALFVAPLAAAGFTLFFVLAAPRAMAKAASAYVAGWLGSIVMLTVGHLAIVMLARGLKVDVPASGTAIAALVFIAIGNFLGKTQPNGLVGVRTPWSKQSDYSWEKTNRAAGRMTVGVGLATLAVLAAAGVHPAHRVLFFGLIAMGLISSVMSYVYYRRDPERSRPEGGNT